MVTHTEMSEFTLNTYTTEQSEDVAINAPTQQEVDEESEESEEEEEEKKQAHVQEEIKVNYKLITSKLLIPFFSIHTRILEKGTKFEIGPIKFIVAGTSPHKLGKVTSET